MHDNEKPWSADSCPLPYLLKMAAEDRVSKAEKLRLQSHFENCPDCLAVYESLVRTTISDAPDPASPGMTHEIGNRDLELKPLAARDASRGFGDRFEVVRKLGYGGMGEVFECLDRKLGRRVAVKKIRSGPFDEGLMIRLEREARIQSALNHPNIVQIFEVGEWAGSTFLAMELLPGRSLKDEIDKSPLAPWHAALIVMQIARALAHAHARNVIHRDLKPSNILLTENPPETRTQPSIRDIQRLCGQRLAVLADFGLAKILDGTSEATQTEVIRGTLDYLSPEQVSGSAKKITGATDIFSLGVVLYESLTGRPPFASHSTSITISLIENADPVPPGEISPDLSMDLETICLKCLEKEPGKRYASAQHLADDLERYLTGSPILARPVSPFVKFDRWCRRNRSTAAAIAFAALCLVLLSAGAIFYAEREAQFRRVATIEAEKAQFAERQALEAERIARIAENQARQAEVLLRKDSDSIRNSVFSGIMALRHIRNMIEKSDSNGQKIVNVRSLAEETKSASDAIVRGYLNRPTVRVDLQGPMIERLFLDGIAIRDMVEPEKSRPIFERLMDLARNCPPDHPDFLNRRSIASRCASVIALLEIDRNRPDLALEILAEGWNSWTIGPDAEGVRSGMLYDREVLGDLYAKQLRKAGKIREAEIVEEKTRGLVSERLRMFPPISPGPI